MAEMRGIGIADVLREMGEVEVLVGEVQQMQLQRWEGNGWLRFGNIIQGANI